ncbi:MAG: hypothetical protein WC720_05590 [Candidatus Shapirobacteria bacterium]|jgi:adenylylsulfate kinase-like enzyme
MIILLNGSINSGKSTVARILAKKISNTANIEVDELREFVNFLPLEDSIKLNIENAALLAENFVKKGYNAIITYPLYKADYDYLIEEFESTNQKIFVFTLSPKLEIALTNRGKRKLTNWEIKRIKYHFDTGIPKPSFGIIIDNSNQKPEETVEKILEIIESK